MNKELISALRTENWTEIRHSQYLLRPSRRRKGTNQKTNPAQRLGKYIREKAS